MRAAAAETASWKPLVVQSSSLFNSLFDSVLEGMCCCFLLGWALTYRVGTQQRKAWQVVNATTWE
jgi:hypothetical protein